MQLSIFFEIFGTEKTEGALEGMLGSVCQSVFGEGCLTDSRREGRGIALFLMTFVFNAVAFRLAQRYKTPAI